MNQGWFRAGHPVYAYVRWCVCNEGRQPANALLCQCYDNYFCRPGYVMAHSDGVASFFQW